MHNFDKYIFALNGPSASGKTTIMVEVIKKLKNIERLVTVTTRPKRPKEMSGVDYIFVTLEQFEKEKNSGNIVEESTYAGIKYGLFGSEVQRIRAAGNNAIVVLDMHGIDELKRFYGNDRVISIFIYRELEDIKRELDLRSVPQAEKDKRFHQAKAEMENQHISDHVVYNTGKLEAAVKAVEDIINSYDSAYKK